MIYSSNVIYLQNINYLKVASPAQVGRVTLLLVDI